MKTLYNLAYLKELAAGDDTFVYSMIEDFIEQAPTTLMQLHEAIDNSEYDKIYSMTHRFIPSIEYMGAQLIQQQFREIEQLAKAQKGIETIKKIFNQAKIDTFALIDILKNDFVRKQNMP